MTLRTIIKSILIPLALTSNIGFSETLPTEVTETPKSTTTQALISPITNNVIIPLYADAAKQANLLNKATFALCEQPNIETLTSTRAQWSNALTAWQTSDIALFGPALVKQRDLHIYFRPVKKRVIKQLWTGDQAITLESVNFAGVGAKGFATVEYLLLDRSFSDDDILARFNSGKSSRHCQHLIAVSTLIKNDIEAIHTSWKTNYPATLSESEEAMALIIGKLEQTAESVSTKLRQALAKDAHLAAKDPKREKRNPHKLEAWRSGHTLSNLNASLLGVKQVLNDGGVLAWLNENKHAELATQITKQLAIIDAIQFKSNDLFQQIEEAELEAADTLFAESIKLDKMIKALAAAMGIQLGFNDSDGD